MFRKSKRSKSVLSGILCMVLLVVMFFSVVFVVKEADHECTGENCPICLEMQACIQTLKNMGTTIGVNLTAAGAFLCAVLIVSIGKHISVSIKTPVQLKVKLTI